jgi:hypothetical protein
VLQDSFDRAWRVDVDGRPAALLRANALYRAVHISPGPHTVTFKYRPIVLYVCLIFSGVTALTMAVAAVKRPTSRRDHGQAVEPDVTVVQTSVTGTDGHRGVGRMGRDENGH